MLKFSIITATYNSSKSIKTAIESVNNQTYKNIEHLFIDGNSSDDTLKLIKQISEVPKKIISEADNGIYDALNKGIRNSDGDIIGLLHSDDFLADNDVIEVVARAFENPDIDGIYGDLNYVSKENPDRVIRHWRGKPFHSSLLLKGWMPAHPTLFLRKSVYETFGNFDTTYRIAADYDFILRIMKNENLKFQYLPKVFCKMRVGGESNKSFSNIKKKSMEDYRALKNNGFKAPAYALLWKNLSKIPQFVSKKVR